MVLFLDTFIIDNGYWLAETRCWWKVPLKGNWNEKSLFWIEESIKIARLYAVKLKLNTGLELQRCSVPNSLWIKPSQLFFLL